MSPIAKMPGVEVSNFSVSTADQVLVQIEPPVRQRAELHGEAEERDQPLAGDAPLAVGTLDVDRLEGAVAAVQARHLADGEVDRAGRRRARAWR